MSKQNDEFELKVIRVNSTMNNSEPKIQMKFCEALGLKDFDRQITSNEFTNKVTEYFQSEPNLSILFVFEDIDYYVETTRQVMLYKILDMLQHCQIKFVFLCTSMILEVRLPVCLGFLVNLDQAVILLIKKLMDLKIIQKQLRDQMTFGLFLLNFRR